MVSQWCLKVFFAGLEFSVGAEEQARHLTSRIASSACPVGVRGSEKPEWARLVPLNLLGNLDVARPSLPLGHFPRPKSSVRSRLLPFYPYWLETRTQQRLAIRYLHSFRVAPLRVPP
jgi:hypothetical protein